MLDLIINVLYLICLLKETIMANNNTQVNYFIDDINCHLIDGKIVSVYGVEVEDNNVNAFLLTHDEPLNSIFEFTQH